MGTFIDDASWSSGFMEDVQLRREAASHVTALGVLISTEAWGWDQGTWIVPTRGHVNHWYICVCLILQVKPLKQICGHRARERLKGLRECCYCHCGSISSFRFYLLEFKANCGISFSISFPRGRMPCPHNARVQRPCQLACANTLLSNDLICNKAECLCSSSWHRMPGEVTKLLYVPLALAAMVNSPAAFMQMSVNTL